MNVGLSLSLSALEGFFASPIASASVLSGRENELELALFQRAQYRGVMVNQNLQLVPLVGIECMGEQWFYYFSNTSPASVGLIGLSLERNCIQSPVHWTDFFSSFNNQNTEFDALQWGCTHMKVVFGQNFTKFSPFISPVAHS